MSNVLKLGLLGSGGKLTIDDRYLLFTHPYVWNNFRVPLESITSVSVDGGGFLKVALKIVGDGSVLAETKMPASWAHKAQDWLLENLPKKVSKDN